MTTRGESPENGKRRRWVGVWATVIVIGAGLVAAALLSWTHSRSSGAGDGDASAMYLCPMHPSIIQDHPGECPICGMKLVQARDAVPSSAPVSQDAGSKQYGRQYGLTPQAGRDAKRDEPAAASNFKAVELDLAAQQLIGLKTAPVKRGLIGGLWRTVGRVAIDETRVRRVNLKVSGFVERVFVDFVGKQVRTGEPLFSMYSPELLAAQEEYLLALRTQTALTQGGGSLAADGDTLVAASRRRLELWDIPARELARIARTGKTQKWVTIYSPVSGVVTQKNLVQGSKLDAGAMPYEVVDLSVVWVLADAYEQDLRFVRVGMAARLTLAAFPGREFNGEVVFIDPVFDAQTRTVKLRLRFPNPKHELRPGLFGEVTLRKQPHDGVYIPQDAVIDSGREQVVFVALGAGTFQPRLISLGEGDQNNVEVLNGLVVGERVVTRANFLLDSESRLRASLAARRESRSYPTGRSNSAVSDLPPAVPHSTPSSSTAPK